MIAQIHVRVSAEFKRALKIYCAREGITEQRWTHEALDAALRQCAPDLARVLASRSKSTTKKGTR